jgi:hypothetical protein
VLTACNLADSAAAPGAGSGAGMVPALARLAIKSALKRQQALATRLHTPSLSLPVVNVPTGSTSEAVAAELSSLSRALMLWGRDDDAASTRSADTLPLGLAIASAAGKQASVGAAAAEGAASPCATEVTTAGAPIGSAGMVTPSLPPASVAAGSAGGGAGGGTTVMSPARIGSSVHSISPSTVPGASGTPGERPHAAAPGATAAGAHAGLLNAGVTTAYGLWAVRAPQPDAATADAAGLPAYAEFAPLRHDGTRRDLPPAAASGGIADAFSHTSAAAVKMRRVDAPAAAGDDAASLAGSLGLGLPNTIGGGSVASGKVGVGGYAGLPTHLGIAEGASFYDMFDTLPESPTAAAAAIVAANEAAAALANPRKGR